MPASKSPPMVEIEREVVEGLLARARAGLPLAPDDVALLERLVDTLVRVTALVRERGTTIARLRRLFGLSGSEKASDVLAPPPPPAGAPDPAAMSKDVPGARTHEDTTPPAAPTPPDVPLAPPADGASKPPVPKRKGHGRVPAAAYLAARHVTVVHESLRTGDTCPKCARGKVFRLKEPAPLLRIVGQAPLVATCWDCERLRCATCGILYTARAPEEAQGEKYDETASSMMALMRYGTGMPLHRLDHLQRNVETPVPSSTQWDVVHQRVHLVRPAYDELVRLAAQGHVLHNDDSYVRILDLMGKRRADLLAAGKLPDPDRTGLFTTAIVALVAAVGTIALFFTGRKHAGENLADVLRHRAADLPPPIQMGDALTRNLPKGHEVKDSNCIAHGRRKIVDEIDNYPAECRFVIERLSRVYKLDEECKARGASDPERLLAHQQTSAPLMDEIHKGMNALLADKRIEPNSGLGEAFGYFLKRWDKFTLFLREPGAPLDNNICERALKMAIKHRNASLFYRSERGARVGDIYMTLIHTAELHLHNPFEYLTALQRNHKAVAASPADWLPWNYKHTLARLHPTTLDA
jgi:transposase